MFLISEPKCTWYLSPWLSSYSNCFYCSSFWTVLWCAQVLSPQRNVITAFPGTPGKGSCVFSVPHGQRGPGYAAHPASLWDQPDILGYQGSWETAHFPVMIKNVLELSKLIVLFFILVSGVWTLMWMFWHELWVEWIDHKAKIIPVSLRDWKLIEERLLRVLIKLHASFQCSLVCSICFCLLSWVQCSLSGNTKTCFSDKLLDSFSFFFPPLKFELNREGERDWFLFCSHFCSGQSINSQHSEGDAGGEPQGEHMMFLFLKRWQLFSLDICQVNCTLLALKPFFDQLYDIVPGFNFYKKLYLECILFYYFILHFCTEPRTWHSDKYIIMTIDVKVVSSFYELFNLF